MVRSVAPPDGSSRPVRCPNDRDPTRTGGTAGRSTSLARHRRRGRPRRRARATPLAVVSMNKREASRLVIAYHYLHRRPSISYAFGLVMNSRSVGVVTFGIPASRNLQISACRQAPDSVIELNRLWCCGDASKRRNLVSVRALSAMPALIVVSYALRRRSDIGVADRATLTCSRTAVDLKSSLTVDAAIRKRRDTVRRDRRNAITLRRGLASAALDLWIMCRAVDALSKVAILDLHREQA